MYGNYRTEKRNSSSVNAPRGSSSHRSEHPAPSKNSDYVLRKYNKFRDAKFFSTLGFPLDSGVLPTKPMETASAATPWPRRRRTPHIVPPKTPAAPAIPIHREEQAKLSPERPAKPVEKLRVMQADAGMPDPVTPPRAIHRKRTVRRLLSLSSGLFAGAFTTLVAIMLGTFWSLETVDHTILAKGGSPSSSAAASKGAVSMSGQPSHQIHAVANRYSGKVRKEMSPVNSQAEVGTVSEQSASIAEPATNSGINPAMDSITDTHQNASDRSKSVSSKKPAETAAKSRQSGRASNKNGRADEINRLKAQAFSETKEDRVGGGKSSRKSSSSSNGSSQKPAKKRAYKARRLAAKNSLADEFKQCKRKSNFFQREKCKWRVCAGKWGKSGCPSYNHDIARY